MKKRAYFAMVWVLLFGFAALAQDDTPKGTTMDLVQEVKLGQLSVRIEAKQSFLPPASFRMEGTASYPELGMTNKTVVVSDGNVVKQYMETPMGPQAVTVDLKKVQEKIPAYKPSQEYDPMMYKTMLENAADKTPLGETEMDGAKVEGYELPAASIGAMPMPGSLGGLQVPQPEKYRVWVNPQDGLLRKMEVLDAAGTALLSMTFTNVKTGVEFPVGTFAYEFPDGATPADMTDMMLQVMGGQLAPAPSAPEPPAAPTPRPEPENP